MIHAHIPSGFPPKKNYYTEIASSSSSSPPSTIATKATKYNNKLLTVFVVKI